MVDNSSKLCMPIGPASAESFVHRPTPARL
jgi:hypothetical protein